MRVAMTTTVLLILFAPIQFAQSGQVETGETLLEMCTDTEDLGSEIGCTGYIVGTVDTWIEASVAAGIALRDAAGADFDQARSVFASFCLSGNVTIRQVMAVVVDYLEANPQQWHQPGAYVVREALAEAFPC